MGDTSPRSQISETSVFNSDPDIVVFDCPICLEGIINESFANPCRHYFCHKCILRWSKVKNVCPVCKETFTSFIHNWKSDTEYSEHFVTPPNAKYTTSVNTGDPETDLAYQEFLYYNRTDVPKSSKRVQSYFKTHSPYSHLGIILREFERVYGIPKQFP